MSTLTIRRIAPVARQLLAAARRIPRAALMCAVVGTLNAAAWSLIVPPFQVPDEPSHYSYVEFLARTGQPPAEPFFHSKPSSYSPEEQLALRWLRFEQVAANPINAGPWTQTEGRRFAHALSTKQSRVSDGHSFSATPQPPLYYSLLAAPYLAASGGTLLDRLMLMRLLSAVLAGLTVLLAFLFLREALPGSPWTWTIGALGIALQPLFAYMSGSVNPDALLFAASAAVFWCVARAFRHGLTPALAGTAGAAMAIGLIGKLTVIGLLPGALLGLLVVSLRQAARPSLRAIRPFAIALGVIAAPVALLMVLNVAAWDRPAIGLISEGLDATTGSSTGEQMSFLWQFYLPPLPGMTHYFAGTTTYDLWFVGWVGRYGWVDTLFPDRVYSAALAPLAALAVLSVRSLVVQRAAVRERIAEVGTYALMTLGLMTLVGLQAYSIHERFGGGGGQTRYLLPLLPLYGAVLVLAVHGAGTRWGRTVAVLIVLGALAHNILSQLLVIGRFYA